MCKDVDTKDVTVSYPNCVPGTERNSAQGISAMQGTAPKIRA